MSVSQDHVGGLSHCDTRALTSLWEQVTGSVSCSFNADITDQWRRTTVTFTEQLYVPECINVTGLWTSHHWVLLNTARSDVSCPAVTRWCSDFTSLKRTSSHWDGTTCCLRSRRRAAAGAADRWRRWSLLLLCEQIVSLLCFLLEHFDCSCDVWT